MAKLSVGTCTGGSWVMQVSAEDAKDALPRLLDAVERGERVVITRHGIPVAELVPARLSGVRLGGLAGVVAPPPAAFLDPTGEDGLRDWGGA